MTLATQCAFDLDSLQTTKVWVVMCGGAFPHSTEVMVAQLATPASNALEPIMANSASTAQACHGK
eukprot:2774561-Amphidinium_carterae.1